MLTATQARNIVGIVGNVISFGLFLSPLPTFLKIFKSKSVEEFKPDPYIATVLNCMCWIFYGMPFVHPDSTLIVTINGVGLVLELIYLAVFCFYASPKGRKKVGIFLVCEVIFVAILALATLFLFHGTKDRSMVVGIVCDVFNIIMYASPLTIMTKVIKTKSVKYMPFTLSLANFLNGCVWTAYALIKFDIYVLVSNGLGAISGSLQLLLYAYYSMCGPKEEDVESKASEVQLSTAQTASRG
ncbi:bidirectional sugar transporter SWEET4 [Momordica charantia]|uniref:Bidirectional sugar transporter SWEET n=1 Tax=Momordica charantia TaxID=3673 RepID=A0A6J1D920_MOMCH|nr:bidirectional sugar transporter SWEET4 [Momordica charantia]XP_022150119.1 bidirectional sugar transporter SWEET4 [Momordica charantia]